MNDIHPDHWDSVRLLERGQLGLATQSRRRGREARARPPPKQSLAELVAELAAIPKQVRALRRSRDYTMWNWLHGLTKAVAITPAMLNSRCISASGAAAAVKV